MKTKVEKLRDVAPQDLVGIYAANSHEPEAEREILMAIIEILLEHTRNNGVTVSDREIRDALKCPILKMERVRSETIMPDGSKLAEDGLDMWLEESLAVIG